MKRLYIEFIDRLQGTIGRETYQNFDCFFMPLRLNKKAYKIVAAEIHKAGAKDKIAGDVSCKIALKRLKQLNKTKGAPVTETELKSLVADLFPDFDPKVLKRAIRANRPPSGCWWLPTVVLSFGGIAGLVWLLNLPYPMIRRPVAKTAPIILLPSYLRMDRNYRGAIAKVEQADQLVNRATSLEDLQLGQEKVNQAQKNLDALPVWFLGYEPQMYRTMFSFGWKFTFDEFKAARAKVGRMDAKIFQEINAYNKLETARLEISQAKQSYQQAEDPTSKQRAIVAWQAGIDKLSQIPANTVAKEQAQDSYQAYIRDFRQVSGLVAGNHRTNKVIAVAQQFHNKTTASCTSPPYSVTRWQECANLLNRAIRVLEKVDLEDEGYLESQTLLATYEAELSEIRIRQQEESDSQRAYDRAQQMITDLPKSINRDNRDRTAKDILRIINQLEKVKSQTTVHNDAVTMINFANKKLKQLR